MEIARFLLECSNNVDPTLSDQHGYTPLSWAAYDGYDELVDLLLERNDIDPNSKDVEGRTSLAAGSHKWA